MFARITFAAIAVALVVLMGAVFTHNLHSGGNWCAHPEGDGNWVVFAAGLCE